MDVFCEQLVKIKRNVASNILMVLTVLAAAALCVIMFIYSIKYYMLIFLIVAVIYGTIKLLGTFCVEYEYIITNGTVDIDKITAKSSRKRVVSFECKDILRTGKVNDSGILAAADKTFICGNKTDSAYYILVKKGAAKAAILIEPEEKFIAGVKECAPKIIQKDLFI